MGYCTVNFFDYIKYNLFNIRTPELVEKMRMEEYSDRISKQKYNFVDLKTKSLTVTCAKFIFEMGIESLGRMLSNFIELSTFTDPYRETLFPQNSKINT